MRLLRDFYQRDTIAVARELLGCVLVHHDAEAGVVRRATIVETEAYVGTHDRACHSSKGRTKRTEVLFGPAGHAYVYLIYGMYDCFNVVTEPEGNACAVLLRAVSPLNDCQGRSDGPGRLTRAMHLDRRHNGLDLVEGPDLYLERGAEGGRQPAPSEIAAGPRIGVDYAGVWAQEPLRFWLRGDPHVSR